MKYVEVILPLPLEGTFTYAVPEGMVEEPCVGGRVVVPLGKTKTYTGIISAITEQAPDFDVRNVYSLLDSKPIVPATQMKLWQWVAEYYLSPIGEVYKSAFPAVLRAEKPRKNRARKQKTLETIAPSTLTPAQQEALDAIKVSPKKTCLLHGVTSSGKTEIYIQLIRETIATGKQVLYLLPEIALTVQITERLQRVFGNDLAIFHSRCTDAERAAIWRKQLSDQPYKVVLGARSAIFVPMQRLGLIIVDEEHEGSYKQQDPAPRYHARSVAAILAQMTGARLLLGTATPSLESYYNALTGKYSYVSLTTRYQGLLLPSVEIVDMKDLRRRKVVRSGYFSPQLLDALRDAFGKGKQAILFHNRRGFSREIECRDCGWVPKCDNCDVSLVYHRTHNILTCHYCGYSYAIPPACPSCNNAQLTHFGLGTEKVEEEFTGYFPEARVARMDLDTTRQKDSYDKIIADFAAGNTDVLIGTQMVTKGLDFDNVLVVGILDADSLLNKPDFRAYENAYQMLLQVSGRAGRKGEQGRVILQTKQAEHPVIQHVAGGMPDSADSVADSADVVDSVPDEKSLEPFLGTVLQERRAFNYPPFSHIINVELRHTRDDVVESAAIELAGRLRAVFGRRVLGPDKPSVARVRQQNIRQIMLKIESRVSLKQVRPHLLEAQRELLKDKRFATLDIFYDVDPMN